MPPSAGATLVALLIVGLGLTSSMRRCTRREASALVTIGLPQAVQVIGPRYREDLCLDAGQAIEASIGIITPIDPY